MKCLGLHIAIDSAFQNSKNLNLDGLYEPPPVEFAFETIGWSILAGLIILMGVILAYIAIRKYIKNRYRREALAVIQQLDDDPNRVLIVLKQVAIYRFGREKVAELSGIHWLHFLEDTARDVQFLSYKSSIQSLLYEQAQLDQSIQKELYFNAIKWVKTHA